jgi:hypothetical protein
MTPSWIIGFGATDQSLWHHICWTSLLWISFYEGISRTTYMPLVLMIVMSLHPWCICHSHSGDVAQNVARNWVQTWQYLCHKWVTCWSLLSCTSLETHIYSLSFSSWCHKLYSLSCYIFLTLMIRNGEGLTWTLCIYNQFYDERVAKAGGRNIFFRDIKEHYYVLMFYSECVRCFHTFLHLVRCKPWSVARC